MATHHDKTLRQLAADADRYAGFYFDPAEQARMLTEQDRPVDGAYVVVAQNQFVPLNRTSAAVLRKFVRGTDLDPSEQRDLENYWQTLNASARELTTALEAGKPIPDVHARARKQQTWPAVGMATTEDEMRALMMEQFEEIRQARIAWQAVDSSTYPTRMPNGIYVYVLWFWHGM
jgi:hypothetical protein